MCLLGLAQLRIYLNPMIKCLNRVLNVKALLGAFNQEKALVGAFSVIVKTDGSFAALLSDDVFRTRSVELL